MATDIQKGRVVQTFETSLATWKVYEGNQGDCPKCGATLEYDGFELTSDTETVSYKCRCDFCDFDGEEVYSIEFSHFAEMETK